VACPWNGLPVDDPALLANTTLAVQIENHPEARPPRNLGLADMVIEAPVEGDVTRYTGIFLCQPTVGLTGPIRSARYYNVDVWQDLHVLTVGFGASNGALGMFAAAGMPYVNGITGAWPWFQRGPGSAPHNLYGDVEAIREALGEHARLDAEAARVDTRRPSLKFSSRAQLPGGNRVLEITIQTNSYWRFGWRWSVPLASWERLEDGTPLRDGAVDQPITAHAVIIQRVTQEIVYGDPDPAGNPRRLQHLVGSGDGTVFVDARAVAVRWSRPTAADSTTWTVVETGQELVLRPGVVWWEIVPIEAPVTLR
jgi:hypothetical protein